MDQRILVTQSFMPPFEEYTKLIKNLWNNRWLTNMGELHQKFQKELTEYLVVPEVSLMVNGHMSLEMSIQALNLTGEVITTPYTFASTTHAIVRNGLKPVFCDINPENCTIDVEKIESLITEKTSAIIPVHVYGQICDINKIYSISKKHHLKVIYDAAHAFGEYIDHSVICKELVSELPLKKSNNNHISIGIGNFGDASIFSFHATKVFHTIEGGCVAYSDHRIGERLYRLKNFGIMSETDVDGIGANAKMNEFQAAMGLCNLKYIDQQISERKKRTERYREHLSGINGIKLLNEQKGVQSNYAYFPVIFEDTFPKNRDEIYEQLKREGIFSRKYFFPLTSQFQCYQDQYNEMLTPIADYISKHVLVLPLYGDLDFNNIDKICKCILSI